MTVKVGPAAEGLGRISEVPHVDLAYVDADKPGYPGLLRGARPAHAPRRLIVLDNTLLGGSVVDPQDERTRS